MGRLDWLQGDGRAISFVTYTIEVTSTTNVTTKG